MVKKAQPQEGMPAFYLAVAEESSDDDWTSLPRRARAKKKKTERKDEDGDEV